MESSLVPLQKINAPRHFVLSSRVNGTLPNVYYLFHLSVAIVETRSLNVAKTFAGARYAEVPKPNNR